jgi:hypothetical protein
MPPTRHNIPELTEHDLIRTPDGTWRLRSDYEAWAAQRTSTEDRSILTWLAGPARPFEDRHLSAIAEYDALTRAAALWPPPCAGDVRWIDDNLSATARAQIAEFCFTACRIRARCAAYALKAMPSGGIWAGYVYTA